MTPTRESKLMSIHIESPADGIVVLRLVGRLFLEDACDIFQEALEECLAIERPRIVLDLSELEKTSSIGLGLLLSWRDRFRGAEGDLRPAALSKTMRTLFDLLVPRGYFEVHDTVESAVESYAA